MSNFPPGMTGKEFKDRFGEPEGVECECAECGAKFISYDLDPVCPECKSENVETLE